MKRTFILFVIFIAVLSCNKKNSKTPTKTLNTIVRIQPFNDVPQVEIDYVENRLKDLYPSIIVSKRIQLPDNALNELKFRYRADSLLKFLNTLLKPNETIIGLTARDISITNGNIPDWGIMGLGTTPGYSCVASSFRLLNSQRLEQLFKVTIHELGHTEGLPHCPTKTCFMRDAEGGNPMNEEKEFCPKCKKYLQSRNWRL